MHLSKHPVYSLLVPLAAACLVLGALETIQQHTGNLLREAHIPFLNTLVGSMVPWLLLLLFLPGILWMAVRYPLDQGRWRRAIPLHAVATLALVAVHQWLCVVVFVNLTTVTTPFWLYWFKLFSFRFAVDSVIYWGIVGLVQARRVSEGAREREAATLRLEASLADARLQALREQLQPHFLFNSLNAMSTLALRGDREAVTRGLATLSDLLRFTLETQRAQEVPLAEELAFIDQYLELMLLRFGDRLTIERDIDDAALDAAIPVMLMQPLVENAIRHGISETPGPGTIRIRAARTEATITLEVQDTGPGFRRTERPEGIGLTNTKERLAALHGTAATIACSNGSETGGRVTVVLPYHPLPLHTPAPV